MKEALARSDLSQEQVENIFKKVDVDMSGAKLIFIATLYPLSLLLIFLLYH